MTAESTEAPPTGRQEPGIDFDTVSAMLDRATVVRVEPGGILLIGNVEERIPADQAKQLARLLQPLRVVIFETDIHVDTITADALLGRLYETGALADGVLHNEATPEGDRLRVEWPNGRQRGLIAPDVVEEIADQINRLRASQPRTQPLDMKDLAD